MPKLQLQCDSCGARIELLLNDAEQRSLRGQGYFMRICKHCAGSTRWLPVAPPAKTSLTEPEEMPSSRRRVLVIDDDEAFLRVLDKAFNPEEFDLETATSGRDAINRLTRQDYDVILSDVRMPEFDGKQLFQFLDEHLPEYKDRVIFLTADSGTTATMEFLKESGQPYLLKPIDISALLALVHQCLPERESLLDEDED